MTSLVGARAIVTGASSGLGAVAASALAGAGAQVAVVARRADRLAALAEEIGGVTVVADLSRPEGPAAAVDEAHERLSGLDILVNAAGITNVARGLVESMDDVRAVLELNLVATYALSQRAAAAMKSTGGAIVNIASIMAVVSEPSIPQAGYAASKGALVSLTRDLAVQWGRYGIRCNALLPGWFPTEMTAELVDDERRVTDMTARVPLGRLGAPGEIGGPVVFLASPASAYMTGQVLVVDGGMSCV